MAVSEHLEFPRPLRLLRTFVWSLAESAGLPIAAYAAGSALAGRDAGLLAGVGATWTIAAYRKIATKSVPGLLMISAIVLTIQAAVVLTTGLLWVFLLQFPLANLCMCLMFARTARGPEPLIARLAAEVVAMRQPAVCPPGLHRFFQHATWLWASVFGLLTACMAVMMWTEPAGTFLLLTTVATLSAVVAGACVSVVWFASVLRRCGLRVRFVPA